MSDLEHRVNKHDTDIALLVQGLDSHVKSCEATNKWILKLVMAVLAGVITSILLQFIHIPH